jgi:membrane fusion protein, multidrug efflux system
MRHFIVVSVILFFVSVISTGCSNTDGVEQASVGPVKGDSVPVFSLKKMVFKKEVNFPGELLPMERTEIFAKVSGYIQSIKVDIGDMVSKGQLIAALEAPEVVANFSQVNADVQTAKSKLAGSLDAYNRITNAAKVEGTIAAGELEKSKSQMMADSSGLAAAKSKLDVYGRLKDYLNIRAPFSGVIVQRNVDHGSLVAAGDPRPLLVIEDNRSLRLRLPVPEVYTGTSTDSLTLKFSVDAFPGMNFKAALSRKTGALDQRNRTEIWEYIYDNSKKLLKSGMYANASLQFGRSVPSFVVPVSAVVTNLEKRFVIRVREGRAEWVDIRNGLTFENRTEIFGDLAEGDLLLVRGTDEIKPGQEIKAKFDR